MAKTLNPYVRFFDKYRINNNEPEVVVWETRHMEIEAKMATIFMEKWGMVSGISDGEDSAGRHRVRLATPLEVVERACEIAELACKEFTKRDWFTEAPSIQEAKDMLTSKDDDDA